jgi:hypothetical protein
VNQLLLISSLVTLVTLGILFFDRNVPLESKIPSFFLGAKVSRAPNRITLSKPPWLLWLLAILATLGFAFVYRGPDLTSELEMKGKAALIWVDGTYSAQLARKENSVAVAKIAQDIIAMGVEVYGLEVSTVLEKNRVVPKYKIVGLPLRGDVETFLERESNTPVQPFLRPIDGPRLAAEVNTNHKFSDGSGAFIAISDGQRQTLENLPGLKGLFSSARLIASPVSSVLSGSRLEILPLELLKLWKADLGETQSFQLIDDKKTLVPDQARPHLLQDTITLKNGAQQKFIVSRDEAAQRLPLLTGCANQVPGPLDLDPFSDIRTLAQFFKAPFRLEFCTESNGISEQSASVNPWKYRSSTVWVVPADDEVLNTLENRSEFWIPAGFHEKSDVLVYVANAKQMAAEGKLSLVPVQLDSEGYPVPLYLMPTPPEGELSFKEGNKSKTATFVPFFTAADKTVLAYQAGKLPIFYLRTTASMPNGELGRASQWTNFWLESGNQTNTDSQAIQRITAMATPSNAEGENETKLDLADFVKRLDAETLNYKDVPTENLILSPGLYSNVTGTKLTLVEVPTGERSRDFLSPAEFDTLFSASEKGFSKGVNQAARSTPFQYAGLGLALLSLYFLWFRKGNLRRINTLLILFYVLPHPAQAQDLDSLLDKFRKMRPRGGFNIEQLSGPIAVPYRIAWCDLEPRAIIEERYKELRETLANRGTIDLPEKIVMGGCQPGKAEIWWTDSPSALSPKAIAEHVSGGGIFILEGTSAQEMPPSVAKLADPSVGLVLESPTKRGTLYRSFYLLRTFDGCVNDGTLLLTLRKKVNAHSPVGIITSARFLAKGNDCFVADEDYRLRSFVNMMYSFLSTDYKEDQLHLPEILTRVRNLGLEP